MPFRQRPRHSWRLRLACLLAAVPVCALAQNLPAPAPLRIIGGPGPGCLAGAVELPAEGPGFQTIRAGKSSFWGAPSAIAGVELLAARAQAAGLPDLYIGDLSRPRGGPIPGGHVSHEIGLDADIYLDLTPKPPLPPAAREDLAPPSLVKPDGRGVDPALWSPGVVTLLHLAATLPGIDRVLVNPAIKQQLCRDVTGDRAWLRMIRPWWDHSAHMHIQFLCPPGQTACRRGPPPPPGDGCDATLAWWFEQLDHPAPPAPPRRPPALPAACAAILGGR